MRPVEKTFALVLPSACAAGRASAVEVELERTLDFTIVERRYGCRMPIHM
jgi:hypothetical protein